MFSHLSHRLGLLFISSLPARVKEQSLEGVKSSGFKSSIALSSMGYQTGLSSWQRSVAVYKCQGTVSFLSFQQQVDSKVDVNANTGDSDNGSLGEVEMM